MTILKSPLSKSAFHGLVSGKAYKSILHMYIVQRLKRLTINHIKEEPVLKREHVLKPA
jgi:hypothetical protein